jgi:hypothetical protein
MFISGVLISKYIINDTDYQDGKAIISIIFIFAITFVSSIISRCICIFCEKKKNKGY